MIFLPKRGIHALKEKISRIKGGGDGPTTGKGLNGKNNGHIRGEVYLVIMAHYSAQEFVISQTAVHERILSDKYRNFSW